MIQRGLHSATAGLLSVLLLLQFAPLSLLMDQNANHASVICEGHGERAVCPHHPQARHDHAVPAPAQAPHAAHGSDHTAGKADKPHRDHREGPALTCGCMAHSATGVLTMTIDKVVTPEAADVEREAIPVSAIRFEEPIPSSQLTDPPFHPPRTIHL